MKIYPFRLIAGLTLVFSVSACAAKRPVLYPNAGFRAVGEEAAQQDIDRCLKMAAAAGLKADRGKKVAGQTAGGAVGGAVVGAAAGAVRSHAGRGAAVGAAAGASGGFMRGLFRSRNPDPIQRRFVEECLREHGYRVIGWR